MTDRHRPAADRPWRFITLMALLGVCGVSSGNIAPILLGLFIDDAGLSVEQASQAISLEFAGFALGLGALALVTPAGSVKRVGQYAAICIAAAHLVTTMTGWSAVFAAARLLAGCGEGAVLGLMFRYVAGRDHPQRTIAAITVFSLICAATLLALSGVVTERLGLAAVLTGLAIFALLALSLLAGLPDRPAAASAHVPSGTSSAEQTKRSMVLTLSVLVVFIGHGALWAFQERIGLHLGLTKGEIGVVLGLSVIGGVLGAAASHAMGLNWGMNKPQLAAYAALIGGALLLTSADSVAIFVVCTAGLKFAWFFGLPFLQGALAAVDRSGRWLSAGGALQYVGSAIGPAAASLFVTETYVLLGLFAATCYLICVALLPMGRVSAQGADA